MCSKGHSYSTDLLCPSRRIIQQGKAEHVPYNGNGIRWELMTDCHGPLPELKTEPMTHLYTPNIPNDKTGLREQLVTVFSLWIPTFIGQRIISYCSQKLWEVKFKYICTLQMTNLFFQIYLKRKHKLKMLNVSCIISSKRLRNILQ